MAAQTAQALPVCEAALGASGAGDVQQALLWLLTGLPRYRPAPSSSSPCPRWPKGVEDTVFYDDARLLALNEVGRDPSPFGASVEEFHEHARHIQGHGSGGRGTTPHALADAWLVRYRVLLPEWRFVDVLTGEPAVSGLLRELVARFPVALLVQG